MNEFNKEEELTEIALRSDEFRKALGHSGWDMWSAKEIKGLFGIPDVVIGFAKKNESGNTVIHTYALEMKLQNWRRALIQSFKYSSFAHYSYVVMDHKYVGRAKRNISEFCKANIGLISVKPSGKVQIHRKPAYRKPYCNNLEKYLSCRIAQELSI